jgi:hypothetical protein
MACVSKLMMVDRAVAQSAIGIASYKTATDEV